jgi:hypothetical protein
MLEASGRTIRRGMPTLAISALGLCSAIAGANAAQTPATSLSASTPTSPLIALPDISAERLIAVPDATGRVHVFAESHEGAIGYRRSIHHFVIAPDGSVGHEVVEPNHSAREGINLSAAYDAHGRLNLTFGTHHMVLDEGGWHAGPSVPWCTWLALAGSRLACVRQDSLNGPMSCFGFSPGGCFPPRNVGISWELADGAWTHTFVINREGNADLSTLALGVDEVGKVEMVYASMDSESAEVRRLSSEPVTSDSTESTAAGGTDVPLGRIARGWSGHCTAIDRTSGTALIIASWASGQAKGSPPQARLVVPGESMPREPIDVPADILCMTPGSLASAGQGRWHAVFLVKRGIMHSPIAYRSLSQGRWSDPIALGGWYHIGAQGENYDYPLIADNGSGLALVIWPLEKKVLAARWVRAAP